MLPKFKQMNLTVVIFSISMTEHAYILNNTSIIYYKKKKKKLLRKMVFQFSSVQSLSHIRLIETPWTTARQTSLSITNSQSLLKLMSIKLVMPSNRLILCRPLLLLPSISPVIRVFSDESVLHTRWPKYLDLSFSISPSNE